MFKKRKIEYNVYKCKGKDINGFNSKMVIKIPALWSNEMISIAVASMFKNVTEINNIRNSINIEEIPYVSFSIYQRDFFNTFHCYLIGSEVIAKRGNSPILVEAKLTSGIKKFSRRRFRKYKKRILITKDDD